MAKRKIRVGFDFDGVVAYNPFRLVRPFIAFVKRRIFGVEELKFYYPKARWQQIFWIVLHESSIFPARGTDQLNQMVEEGKIEAHLVTARYSFLDDHLYNWLDKYSLRKAFASVSLNKNDEQPHKFKERIIRELKLDYFVEDNWDIVNYLSSRLNSSKSKFKSQPGTRTSTVQGCPVSVSDLMLGQNSKQWNNAEIHWIYNIFDCHISYPHKHPYLEKFLGELRETLEKPDEI